MGIQTYALTAQRVGVIKGRILKHANPVIALGNVGINEDYKKNMGDTVKYRRWLPKGATTTQPNRFFQDATGDRGNSYANDHLTSDGVTPAAETLTPQDITCTLNQYSVLYGYTDKTFDLYEDDVPLAMTQLTGERLGLVHEMVLFGALKGCTNKFYGGTGTARASVNGALSLTLLRRVARSMNLNHAQPIQRMNQRISATGMYNTAPVGRCFPVWVSTDLMPDLRDLPNFVPVEKYSNANQAVENEVGACEEFRFIASPELIEVQDGGAAVAGIVPALKSTSATYADVYQVVVGSQDAWGHVGVNLQGKDISALPPGQKDKNDPLGQRGYVGAKFYYNACVLNNTQMAIVEVATRALTD